MMLASVLTAVMAVAACGDSGSGNSSSTSTAPSAAAAAERPQQGGTVVDLLDQNFNGSWPSGLDPATNTTGGGNITQQQAIFGGLFTLRSDADGTNGHIAGNQAASGTLSKDARTLTIKLRPGIKFSDGTDLDAAAVIWNFKRDTDSSCTCAPAWKVSKTNPFTSPDPLTVVVKFSEPEAAILHSFPFSNVNWIASPTAYKKMGENKFKLKPVGAGPFTVVSNKLNYRLVLERNPTYFRKGLPHLDKLIFQSIGGDQPAYQAILAGQADTYEGASTPNVIAKAQKDAKIKVTVQPGSAPYLVQMNTLVPPFDNQKAREAIYYATDWESISRGLFGGEPKLVQGFTTPTDLYYHAKIPGYRTYNLAKAKQLVKELGGLSFEIDAISVYSAKEIMTALQSQWQKAGMKVTVKAFQLNALVKRYESGKWQSFLETTGGWDPGVSGSSSIAFLFGSTSPFTGTKDPKLDKLLASATATGADAQRDKAYEAIAKYLSDHAYAAFGFAVGRAQFVAKDVYGPGLTTKEPGFGNVGVLWDEVWKSKD